LQRIASITSDNPLDKVGVIASCACALHCMLAPLVVVVLPLVGLRFLTDEHTEWILVGTSIVIGVASLLPSYLRHRRTRPIALFALGLCLILSARLVLESNLAVELPILIVGALFVSLSHLINRKLCQSCLSCARAAPANKH
jgi:hypothetical protein